jgi:hypothetical protein
VFPALVILLALVPLLSAVGSEAQEWINIRVNQDETTQLQNEEQIAINPTNPDNMVAVWRDFRLGYRQVGWGYTFDGGQTWTEGGLIDEPNYPRQSDPGITADLDGNFYAIVLSYTGDTGQENGLYVLKSTDGGVTWGAPLEVVNQVPNVFEDKEFIACDRTDSSHEGNLYVTWTRFGSTTDIIARRSTDSGQTWSGDIFVSDDNFVQFPIPVVGRGGEVYIAWTSYAFDAIMIDISVNGGASFGPDNIVTTVYEPSTVLNGGVNAYSSPHMDADITDGPFSGRLYIAYMDRRHPANDRDIFVIFSDDFGGSWSAPIRINDDELANGKDQFLPWLWVDNQGIVTVVFLDRRDDPANRLYHCYITQSTDGGLTWSENDRVSTEPSDPNDAMVHGLPYGDVLSDDGGPQISQARAGLLGEYIGVVAWDGRPTPIWTDIRNGHQDAYVGYLDTGASVQEPLLTDLTLPILVAPNPVQAGRGVTVRSPAEGPVVLRIYDTAGRVIRTLARNSSTGAATALDWDGLGQDGHPAKSGIYFLRLSSETKDVTGKVVIVQ